MTNTILQQLTESLEAIPPLELEAVRLLSELRPPAGEWFPTNFTPEAKTQVIAATVELVAYTQRCAEMGRRLAHLPAIPLTITLIEFAL